jgi:undecaprenyl diphosphate synthase/tritrans,polycis-undecaprenyl-diphosphate synthase [geranylgeranyl-diphosphate specific]
MPSCDGHLEGAHRVEDFLSWCKEYPQIKMVSIFALSTENLNRKSEEVRVLWKVYSDELRKLVDKAKEDNIRVRVVGDEGL